MFDFTDDGIPAPGRDAFERKDPYSRESRAAQLLAIAEQLTRPKKPNVTLEDLEDLEDDEASVERLNLLGTPKVESVLDELGGPSFELRREIGQKKSRHEQRHDDATLWDRLNRSGTVDTALDILDEGLGDESLLVRVASAGSLIVMHLASGDEIDQVPYGYVRILQEAATTGDLTSKGVADRFLDLVTPQRPAIRPRLPKRQVADSLSIGVHGTFVRFRDSPLTPRNPFHHYLRNELTANLHADPVTRFRWSGRYSAFDREDGAQRLIRWADKAAGRPQLDVLYAHSHGGNVALSAIRDGLQVRLLILLSTPALRRSPDEWARINANTSSAIIYRSAFDHVLLADRLASRFTSAGTLARLWTEADFSKHFRAVRPTYISPFGHSRWLSPEVWRRKIEDDVRYEHLEAGGMPVP